MKSKKLNNFKNYLRPKKIIKHFREILKKLEKFRGNFLRFVIAKNTVIREHPRKIEAREPKCLLRLKNVTAQGGLLGILIKAQKFLGRNLTKNCPDYSF